MFRFDRLLPLSLNWFGPDRCLSVKEASAGSLCVVITDTLKPTYQQLQKMKLDKSPFVVVSVIGQELLTHGFHGAAVVVLEAGLKIGTCSLKLRGSVFSALSSAYWSLGNAEKSLAFMQQDLEVTKTLGRRRTKHQGRNTNQTVSFHVTCVSSTGDQSGECRAHGNLGSALFSKGSYREALANHRHQLVLAMKLKDREVRLLCQCPQSTFMWRLEDVAAEPVGGAVHSQWTGLGPVAPVLEETLVNLLPGVITLVTSFLTFDPRDLCSVSCFQSSHVYSDLSLSSRLAHTHTD